MNTLAMPVFVEEARKTRTVPPLHEPNEETLAALRESVRISRDPSVKGYSDVAEMMKEILVAENPDGWGPEDEREQYSLSRLTQEERNAIFCPTEPLTENGFTVAEETRILRILQDVRSGKAKTYSDEEAARYLGLDD